MINRLIEEIEVPERMQRLAVHLPPDIELRIVVRDPDSLSGLQLIQPTPPQEIFYIDGACVGNGTPTFRGSWAVCATDNKELSASGLVEDSRTSNQVAELTAAIKP